MQLAYRSSSYAVQRQGWAGGQAAPRGSPREALHAHACACAAQSCMWLLQLCMLCSPGRRKHCCSMQQSSLGCMGMCSCVGGPGGRGYLRYPIQALRMATQVSPSALAPPLYPYPPQPSQATQSPSPALEVYPFLAQASTTQLRPLPYPSMPWLPYQAIFALVPCNSVAGGLHSAPLTTINCVMRKPKLKA